MLVANLIERRGTADIPMAAFDPERFNV
jgi:hypothetical protein